MFYISFNYGWTRKTKWWVSKFRLFHKPILKELILHQSKAIIVLSLNLKRYFTCDHFSKSYEGLKIAILAKLEN